MHPAAHPHFSLTVEALTPATDGQRRVASRVDPAPYRPASSRLDPLTLQDMLILSKAWRTSLEEISSYEYRSMFVALAALALTMLPAFAFADADLGQQMSNPANSHPNEFDHGWECNYGFMRNVGGACLPIHVPAHAFINSAADGWDCERGYTRDAARCVPIVLPANAHLMDLSVGKGWECNVGYNEDGNTCRSLQVPEHAYPIYGRFESRWECERGYRALGNSCAAVRVPLNGFLDDPAMTGRASEVSNENKRVVHASRCLSTLILMRPATTGTAIGASRARGASVWQSSTVSQKWRQTERQRLLCRSSEDWPSNSAWRPVTICAAALRIAVRGELAT